MSRQKIPPYAYAISAFAASIFGFTMYIGLFEAASDANIKKSNADVMPFVQDVTTTVNRLVKQDELRAEDAATILALEERGETLQRNQNDDDLGALIYPFRYQELLDELERIQQLGDDMTAYEKARAVAELKSASEQFVIQTAQAIEDEYAFWDTTRYIGTPIGIIVVISIFFGIPEYMRPDED